MAVPTDGRDRPAPTDGRDRPARVGEATVTETDKDDGRLLLLYRWPV